jgi:Zn finger protein HypA/HybF involved in hydrogenase expression
VSDVVPFARTLEQEVLALARGASMECLVCGEFVLRRDGVLACPECASIVRGAGGSAGTQLEFETQAG